jgi:hypothetical protein
MRMDSGTGGSVNRIGVAEAIAVYEAIMKDAARYQWLRKEFKEGRETYIGEAMMSGRELDEYIDGKAGNVQHIPTLAR